MKHVHESLNQYYDYKFFKVFEEDEKADLQSKEKNGLAVIDKIQKNFEDFKKNSKGEILKYKEFWEENQKAKEGFDTGGAIYKMYDGNYVVGVMELPAETLSDGSIDGGMGATDEPEEEIIEGKEITQDEEEPGEEFFEEQTVSGATNEATDEEEGIDLDLDAKEKPEEEGVDMDLNLEDDPTTGGEGVDMDLDLDAETPEGGEEVDIDSGKDTGLDLGAGAEMETPIDQPIDSTPDLTAPQKYFVVYDISGDDREEIFRTGSNNVVNAFNTFFNDNFKGSMKNAIIQFKERKVAEKKDAEKAEKTKVETEKESKIQKFLGEN